jgi:transcriptional regulator with XRE-family HTH domain
MAKPIQRETVFTKRLKEARQQAGYTQMQLGVLAGIEEFSASARVNQYERGVHTPGHGTAERLAEALSVPVSYFYEMDDQLAEIILIYGQISVKEKQKLTSAARALLA